MSSPRLRIRSTQTGSKRYGGKRSRKTSGVRKGSSDSLRGRSARQGFAASPRARKRRSAEKGPAGRYRRLSGRMGQFAWIAAARVRPVVRANWNSGFKAKGGSDAKADCNCVLVDGCCLRIFVRHGGVCRSHRDIGHQGSPPHLVVTSSPVMFPKTAPVLPALGPFLFWKAGNRSQDGPLIEIQIGTEGDYHGPDLSLRDVFGPGRPRDRVCLGDPKYQVAAASG